MKVAVFSTKSYDRTFLTDANLADGDRHRFHFLEPRLNADTASLAGGASAVCAFVNDELNASALAALSKEGVRLVALRCAGFNHVDLNAAQQLNIAVARVPAYSPAAVAEHTVAIIMSLNRKIHRAYARVREGNFSLDGLLGFDLCGRTVGIIGTGKIGIAVARILRGFGCDVVANDPLPNAEFERIGGTYVTLPELLSMSDIITLHCPLTPATRHLINADAITATKPGVMLINTSRGGVADTKAIIAGLKSGAIGYLGLDVYEEEGDLFFEDLSEQMIQDDVFARLLTFPNVLITGHQAFFTAEAMTAIAATTIGNISSFEDHGRSEHQISVERLV
ncbi:2-hydroxyacid dehydrogenase [Sphingorhabdus sp.]|uniref:2-hydroxyacid dehydrogenase n=1 Tax=Sphingorhabdus sp. TaxID=1902408 RepID=UPI0035B2AC36